MWENGNRTKDNAWSPNILEGFIIATNKYSHLVEKVLGPVCQSWEFRVHVRTHHAVQQETRGIMDLFTYSFDECFVLILIHLVSSR